MITEILVTKTISQYNGPKFLAHRTGKEVYKMSLEHLIAPENKAMPFSKKKKIKSDKAMSKGNRSQLTAGTMLELEQA